MEQCDDMWSLALNALDTPGHTVRLSVTWMVGTAALVFVASTLSNNYSQVDRLWSILPCIYAWMFVTDERTLLMAGVVTIWGVRLTYNFNRRGGYTWIPWYGQEDYRWEHTRSGKDMPILANNIAWSIFNLVFISIYQNFLLYAMVSPSLFAHMAATTPGCQQPLNIYDAIASVGFVGTVIIESIADNQQHAFQSEKYRRINAGEKLDGHYADGFCQTGLFAIVRKPNYAAEQLLWIIYYIFSIAAAGSIINFTLTGCVIVCLLFQASASMTEGISASKYPKYAEYKKKVPLFLPISLSKSTKIS